MRESKWESEHGKVQVRGEERRREWEGQEGREQERSGQEQASPDEG